MIDFSVSCHWNAGSKLYTATVGDNTIAKLFLKRASRIKGFDYEAYAVESFPVNKIFYIDYIRVDLEFRKMGVASELLEECKRWAHISRNILTLDALALDDTVTNAQLNTFYKSRGFKVPPIGAHDKTYSSMTYHTRLKQN